MNDELMHTNFDFKGFDVPDLQALTMAAVEEQAGGMGDDEDDAPLGTVTGKSGGKKKRRPTLFTPMTLRGLTIRNRIWLPPMDTYSAMARDGKPTPFHYQHYVSRAVGGFGMIIAEATAVAPEGRISPCDVGLWEDGQIDSWRWIVDDIKKAGAVAAIQLNHAGRKGSTGCFAVGHDGESVPESEGGWPTVAPSPIPYGILNEPRQLSVDEIHGLVGAFAAAAGRSLFLIEIVDAVRGVIPEDMPLLVRISATDWAAGGWDLSQTVKLARMLKEHGVDLVDVSTGGIVSGVSVPVKPNYQVPFSEKVRAKAGVQVTAVGLIAKPKQAAKILAHGEADAVEIGRAALRDPYWPLRAANKLGISVEAAPYQPQYRRGAF